MCESRRTAPHREQNMRFSFALSRVAPANARHEVGLALFLITNVAVSRPSMPSSSFENGWADDVSLFLRWSHLHTGDDPTQVFCELNQVAD